MKRHVNRQLHLCGCETRFDTEKWHSEITKPCSAHAVMLEHHNAACGSTCSWWPHCADRTDPGLTWCTWCHAVSGSPAGLCATHTSAPPIFGRHPKPQDACRCGTDHTPQPDPVLDYATMVFG